MSICFDVGLVALILGGLTARTRRARSAVEGQRVAGLVQTALDTLRAQEREYHADPLSASAPYLSSLQLRDVVLAHSVPARAALVQGRAHRRGECKRTGEPRGGRWWGRDARVALGWRAFADERERVRTGMVMVYIVVYLLYSYCSMLHIPRCSVLGTTEVAGRYPREARRKRRFHAREAQGEQTDLGSSVCGAARQ